MEEGRTSSAKQRKRKLMPLRQQNILDLPPLADFDLEGRLKPVCPYVSATKRAESPSSKGSDAAVVNKPSKTSLILQATSVTNLSDLEKKNAQVSVTSCTIDATPQKRSERLIEKSSGTTRFIVCTFMHRKDVNSVVEVVNKLGGSKIEPNVSSKSTHVVCGDEKRTIKLLRGIAYGCWLIRWEWVMHSMEAGYWIEEEAYELQTFSGVRECRLARKTASYKNELFNNGDAIYLAKNTCPPHSDLYSLLQLCGAKVVKSVGEANVIVGEGKINTNEAVVQVNEKWILDSIQEYRLQPKRKYLVP